MNKSDLIEILSKKNPEIPHEDIKSALNMILRQIVSALYQKRRVEIRGFGTFSLKNRKAGKGRNPKTGEIVYVPDKYYSAFKPSKALNKNIGKKD